MAFDFENTLKGMLAAAHGVVKKELPQVKECVEHVLREEEEVLKEIAQARLDGKINDDELKSQLEDEKEVVEVAMLACSVRAKKLAQEAANAAIKVLHDAVGAAIKAL